MSDNVSNDWRGGRGITPVTRRRMQRTKLANPTRRISMHCACGEGFSADPDDYFYREMDERFEACATCGEAYELGYTRSEWVPV